MLFYCPFSSRGLLQHAAHVPPKPLRACLHAATLVLTIPSVLVRSPNIPMPHIIRRWTSTSYIPISRCVTYIFVILLSFVPVSVFSVLSDVSLVLALLGTYLLPGARHRSQSPTNSLIHFQHVFMSSSTTLENRCRSSCLRKLPRLMAQGGRATRWVTNCCNERNKPCKDGDCTEGWFGI